MGSSHLFYYEKHTLHGRFVMELKMYEIEDDYKYPHKIKYSLFCKDLMISRFVLMDNHYPKGHHIHVDEMQSSYNFISEVQLMADFKNLVAKELGVLI